MMSDTRLAIREFRFLDEKRKLTTLSSVEEQRWLELKQLLGVADSAPAVPAAPPPASYPDPGPGYYATDGNWYPLPPGYEPSGLDFNPDQMYGGAYPGSAAEPQSSYPEQPPSYAQEYPNPAFDSGAYASYPPDEYLTPPAPQQEWQPAPVFADQARTPQSEPPQSAAHLLGFAEGADAATWPAAELLGLSEPPPSVPPSSPDAQGWTEEGGSEDVMELDPSDVTLLEPESLGDPVPKPFEAKPQAYIPAQLRQPIEPRPSYSTRLSHDPPPPTPAEPRPFQPPAPPLAAEPAPQFSAPLPLQQVPAPVAPEQGEAPSVVQVSEDLTIDLSAAEAIDSGEFKVPESAPFQEPASPTEPSSPLKGASAAHDDFDVEVSGSFAALADQEALAPSSAADGLLVEGEHRVIIHMHEGQVKRGVIRDANLLADAIHLEQSDQVEDVPADRVKAIFFMVHGKSASLSSGQKIRVTLTDGRQVVGFSTDFRGEAPGFFLVPADTRTNTARVYLYRSAVESIIEE